MGKSEFILHMSKVVIAAGTICSLLFLVSGILQNSPGSNYLTLLARISPVAILGGVLVVTIRGLFEVGEKPKGPEESDKTHRVGAHVDELEANRALNGHANGFDSPHSSPAIPASIKREDADQLD